MALISHPQIMSFCQMCFSHIPSSEAQFASRAFVRRFSSVFLFVRLQAFCIAQLSSAMFAYIIPFTRVYFKSMLCCKIFIAALASKSGIDAGVKFLMPIFCRRFCKAFSTKTALMRLFARVNPRVFLQSGGRCASVVAIIAF